jgi:hypothetical protein
MNARILHFIVLIYLQFPMRGLFFLTMEYLTQHKDSVIFLDKAVHALYRRYASSLGRMHACVISPACASLIVHSPMIVVRSKKIDFANDCQCVGKCLCVAMGSRSVTVAACLRSLLADTGQCVA